MKFHGGADMAKRLNSLPGAVSRNVQRNALRKGAEPIRAGMASLAPRDPDSAPPHLADNIVIGTRSKTREREGEVIVEVGPALKPNDFFYGIFPEFGTVRQQAQPFARPGFDNNAHRSLGIIMAEMWGAIRKKLGLGGGRSPTGGNL